MGDEIFQKIKRKYQKSNKYMLYVSYEDIGTLIQIIENNEEKKITFEYFNDYELKEIVGLYLKDFLKEIIKKDYISKKKLYKHIEMLEKENCHENCGIEKLIDCGRQCSIGCTIKILKNIGGIKKWN